MIHLIEQVCNLKIKSGHGGKQNLTAYMERVKNNLQFFIPKGSESLKQTLFIPCPDKTSVQASPVSQQPTAVKFAAKVSILMSLSCRMRPTRGKGWV